MKKIFTLLALCLSAVTSFAQEFTTTLVDGDSYYITVGNKGPATAGYLTAGENGAKCVSNSPFDNLVEKQTWKAQKVEGTDNAWTFTATVDGTEYTLYTDASDSRLHAGSEPGENFTNFVVTFNTDDPSVQYANVQMVDPLPDNGQGYVNIWGGQGLNKEFGPYSIPDNGCQVFFVNPTSVELIEAPHWNFDFNVYTPGVNSTRYFIQFNRDITTYKKEDGGPMGNGGLTGNNLVLSVYNDTLVADSVIAGDADFANKIWHIKEYDASTHQIKLQNEAGKYIVYKTLDAKVPGGNTMFTRNEETGEYVRTGNSGGGDLTEAWMATDKEEEVTPVYVFDSNQGSECYAIGDSQENTGNTFINAWGNVHWHHFMGKWSVNDPNCALKFVPITEVLQESEIPADPTTGIATLTAAKKVTDGTVYTVDGRVAGKSLNGLAKGLYIVNGKKVVK